jgi:hypothetical protein
VRGTEAALEWLQTSGYQITVFNPAGAVNILLKLVEDGQFQEALTAAVALPASFLEQAPALYFVRANLKLAAALPQDQKGFIFGGLSLNPRALRLANDPASRLQIKSAVEDLKRLAPLADQLKLTRNKDYLDELMLWVQLEDPDTRDQAISIVAVELGDPAKTLRRVRLALSYDISFNKEALIRHLRSQKAIGGWTDDERFAAFLLAFSGGDPAAAANFFEEHRTELFEKYVLPGDALAAIEVEILGRAGRFEEARSRLIEHDGRHLTSEQVGILSDILAGIESGDEAERTRRRYEDTRGLNDLMVLIDVLKANADFRQLATYAPALVRTTKRSEDFRLALGALFNERRYDELLALADEFPELYSHDAEFGSLKGWSLFHIGRIIEARSVARELMTKRGNQNDIELAINTSIESGDWGYLQSILVREMTRMDTLEPRALMRLSRLALEVGSPYVDQFRDAALSKAPDDPQVHLAAYMLAVERGEEYQGSLAHEWLQNAVRLSGPEGPVQSVPIKEIVDRARGWNQHISRIGQLLREGRTPLVFAAHALRRQPMEFIFGQALRNETSADPRFQSPVLAFSGARPLVTVEKDQRVALDLTTLFTLELVAALDDVLQKYDRLFVAPTTLSALFMERQYLRVRQPSEAARAQRLQNLISSGLLRVLPEQRMTQRAALAELDDDLAAILSRAEQDDAIAVRSAPVFKAGSLLEEVADLSAFGNVLADTRTVLAFLSGKVDASVELTSRTYLDQVDSGWQTNPVITSAATLYLDDLAITYLDHVGLLEPLARSVKALYICHRSKESVEATLRFADFAGSLLAAVERIRAAINNGLEIGSIHFTRRRLRGLADNDLSESDDAPSQPLVPTLDIMSNLGDVDAVACDDRFLNKNPFWTDPNNHRVPTVSSLDLLASLVNRQEFPAAKFRQAKNKLRSCGYYAVPLETEELLAQLERGNSGGGVVLETPELRAIRESTSLARRARVFLEEEAPWLLNVRMAFAQAFRDLWLRAQTAQQTAPKAEWLLAFIPDPLAWCLNPEDEQRWNVSAQQAAAQYTFLLSFFSADNTRRDEFAEWIEKVLTEPLRANRRWLWEMTANAAKIYVKRMLEASR